MNPFKVVGYGWQWLLLATCGISAVWAYSNGQVFPACNSMMPLHLSLGPQWSVSPYSVTATQNPDGSVDVTLKAEVEGDMFKGFLIQARNNSNHMVGNFVAVPPSAQLLQCGYNGGAVSHNNADGKKVVTVLWMNGLHAGDVTFRATVVRNYLTYWTQIKSPTYNYVPSPTGPTAAHGPHYNEVTDRTHKSSHH